MFCPLYCLWCCICLEEAIRISHEGEKKVMIEEEQLSGVKGKEIAAIMQP